MKKIGILAVIIMLMAFATAAQAERAGGLSELNVDSRINDCPNCVVTIALNVEFDTDKAVVKEKYNSKRGSFNN